MNQETKRKNKIQHKTDIIFKYGQVKNNDYKFIQVDNTELCGELNSPLLLFMFCYFPYRMES